MLAHYERERDEYERACAKLEAYWRKREARKAQVDKREARAIRNVREALALERRSLGTQASLKRELELKRELKTLEYKARKRAETYADELKFEALKRKRLAIRKRQIDTLKRKYESEAQAHAHAYPQAQA